MCLVFGIIVHSLCVYLHRTVFDVEELEGLPCFEIAHHSGCMGLWIPKGIEVDWILRQGKAVKKASYRVSISHPIYRALMQSCGFSNELSHRHRKRKTAMMSVKWKNLSWTIDLEKMKMMIERKMTILLISLKIVYRRRRRVYEMVSVWATS